MDQRKRRYSERITALEYIIDRITSPGRGLAPHYHCNPYIDNNRRYRIDREVNRYVYQLERKLEKARAEFFAGPVDLD